MTDYNLLKKQLLALSDEEKYFVPLLANASALIFEAMDDLNWAGFYLMNKGSLLLGPFQGKVACIRIPLGKGVCGTAAQKNETLVVDNVHEFAGHIACDGASNSEIVIPVHKNGEVVGVLDIDSPKFSRFTNEDKLGLEEFVKALEKATKDEVEKRQDFITLFAQAWKEVSNGKKLSSILNSMSFKPEIDISFTFRKRLLNLLQP